MRFKGSVQLCEFRITYETDKKTGETHRTAIVVLAFDCDKSDTEEIFGFELADMAFGVIRDDGSCPWKKIVYNKIEGKHSIKLYDAPSHAMIDSVSPIMTTPSFPHYKDVLSVQGIDTICVKIALPIEVDSVVDTSAIGKLAQRVGEGVGVEIDKQQLELLYDSDSDDADAQQALG